MKNDQTSSLYSPGFMGEMLAAFFKNMPANIGAPVFAQTQIEQGNQKYEL